MSDPDRVLIAALGAKDAGSSKTKRGHFIFAKGGELVEKKLSVSPGDRYVIVNYQSWHKAQKRADAFITYTVPPLPLNLSNRLIRILRRRLQAGRVRLMKTVCGHVESLLFPLVQYNPGSELKKPRLGPESRELTSLIDALDAILSFTHWYHCS